MGVVENGEEVLMSESVDKNLSTLFRELYQADMETVETVETATKKLS